MSVPFYVNPETVVREKAEFARRNIARGRAVIALELTDGVLIASENRSTHLRKTAELYDRIAFAGVGRFSEIDSLRIAGVRLADMRGYSYHREDVTARALANAYAQTLTTVFTNDFKPYEVEILVAQVGEAPGEPNEIYHLRFDGYVSDEHGYMVMGGEAEDISTRLAESYRDDLDLAGGIELVAQTLSSNAEEPLGPGDLEVSLLASSGGRRRFRRILRPAIEEILAHGADHQDPPDPSIAVDPQD